MTPCLPRPSTNPFLRPSTFSTSSALIPCSSRSTNTFLSVPTSTYLRPCHPLFPASTLSRSCSSCIRCRAESIARAGLFRGLGVVAGFEDTVLSVVEGTPGPVGGAEEAPDTVLLVTVLVGEDRDEGEYVGFGWTGPSVRRWAASWGSRPSRSMPGQHCQFIGLYLSALSFRRLRTLIPRSTRLSLLPSWRWRRWCGSSTAVILSSPCGSHCSHRGPGVIPWHGSIL